MDSRAEAESFRATTETATTQKFSPAERVSSSPSSESGQEPSTIFTSQDQPLIRHLQEGRGLDSHQVSPSSTEKQGTVIPASAANIPDDTTMLDMDRRRAETVLSNEEKTVGTKSTADVQQAMGKSEMRVVHPRVESMAVRRESQLSESPKSALKVEMAKPIGVVLPRENAPEPEPSVVQIHIGRIEVRAIVPPPAQPVTKPAPAQPRMSLEDYLRQREGRR